MKSLRLQMMIFFGASIAAVLVILGTVIVIQVTVSVIGMTEKSNELVTQARAQEIGKLVQGYIREMASFHSRRCSSPATPPKPPRFSKEAVLS